MAIGIGLYVDDFPIIKSDIDLIIESLSHILLTVPGERVGNPEFGSNLRLLLFQFEELLLQDIEQEVVSSIAKWEPRVIVEEVLVIPQNPLYHKFKIDMRVQLKETLEEFELEQVLEI